MPLVYTKDEVKAYLAGRGFDVTNEAVINQFIHDLKKLVKYEDRQRRRVRLGHDPQDTNLESTGHSADGIFGGNGRDGQRTRPHTAPGVPRKKGDESSSSRPHKGDERSSSRPHKGDERSTRTQAGDERATHPQVGNERATHPQSGNARSTRPQKGDERSTHAQNGDERFKHPQKGDERSTHPKKGDERSTHPQKGDERSTLPQNGSVDEPCSSRVPTTRLQGPDMLRILGRLLEESDKEDDFESATTAKTLRGPSNRVKRDPVALYHYYKKYWDKLKIPGDNRHMQTRWNTRAQTVGNFPCFEGHAVNYLTRH